MNTVELNDSQSKLVHTISFHFEFDLFSNTTRVLALASTTGLASAVS